MKKILAVLLLLLFLILAWFSWGWYKDSVVCCGEEATAIVQYGPLIFDCDSNSVITNDLWPDKKQEILGERPDGKKLLLVGPYFGSESDNQGVARAEEVKLLFSELSAADIFTSSRFGGDCEVTKENMLHELKYKWITRNDDIIEHFDRTLVFYKYDSTEEITNPQVLEYFDELSSFLISSNDNIVITGHTDSDGDEQYNVELGLKRAAEYRDHLVSLGVDISKISIQSQGESMPISPNDTEENKKMNRRVEIHIVE